MSGCRCPIYSTVAVALFPDNVLINKFSLSISNTSPTANVEPSVNVTDSVEELIPPFKVVDNTPDEKESLFDAFEACVFELLDTKSNFKEEICGTLLFTNPKSYWVGLFQYT